MTDWQASADPVYPPASDASGCLSSDGAPDTGWPEAARDPENPVSEDWPQTPPVRRGARVVELRAVARELALHNYESSPDAAAGTDPAGVSHADLASFRRNRSKRRCAFIARETARIYQRLLENEVRESSAVCRILDTHIHDLRDWNDAMRALIARLRTFPQQQQHHLQPRDDIPPQRDAAEDHTGPPIDPDHLELSTMLDANEEGLRQLLLEMNTESGDAALAEGGQSVLQYRVT